MTDPSQYFKGRTVQEQMDEVIGYVDVRSAEVATTAIASDVAQVHQDMLDADADASAAAASAAAAAGTLANAVKKTGEASQNIAGDIAVSGDLSTGGLISGTRIEAPTPVFNADAANKKYVDDSDAALKTYVDSQDALKISISAINSYAVGLTGNQGPIAGEKTFSNNIKQKTTGTSIPRLVQIANIDSLVVPDSFLYLAGGFNIRDMNDRTIWSVACYRDIGGRDVLSFEGNASDGTTTAYFHLEIGPNGHRKITTNFDKPSNW